MGIELRKQPKQARSLQRFNAILSYAEQIIQSVGVTHFKISDLARRANVNIATIYQYFPNQASLLRHLMEKNVEAFINYVSEPSISTSVQLERAVDVILDRCQEFFLSHPVFFQLRGVSQANEELKMLSVQDTHRIVDSFMASVTQCLPSHISEGRARDALFLLIEACMHLLQVSSALGEDARKKIVSETKQMIVGYLETLE